MLSRHGAGQHTKHRGITASFAVILILVTHQQGTAAGRCHSSSGTRHSKDRLSAAQGQCRFEDAQPRYHVECPDMPNFEESPATVVTSYMHSPSKHTVEEYFDWIENFLALNASVIAFVDIPYHDRLEQLPSNARVIFVPTSLSSFRAMGCGLTLWKHENSRDCERKTHSPPLYAIWAEKASMLHEASLANCFRSTHLFWVDIGCFRKPLPRNSPESALPPFPRPEILRGIRPGAMLMSVLSTATVEWAWRNYTDALAESGISSIPGPGEREIPVGTEECPINTIDGSTFGGDLQAIADFQRAYYATLDTFLRRGWFAGKDQMIFTSMCLNSMSLCHMHEAKIGWFETQRILAGEQEIRTWQLPESAYVLSA